MCPACMATVALLIGSAVSSGGVAAAVASKLLGKSFVKSVKEENQRRKHVGSHV